jgi:hypothetical protein
VRPFTVAGGMEGEWKGGGGEGTGVVLEAWKEKGREEGDEIRAVASACSSGVRSAPSCQPARRGGDLRHRVGLLIEEEIRAVTSACRDEPEKHNSPPPTLGRASSWPREKTHRLG